jgi:hypothetical protein
MLVLGAAALYSSTSYVVVESTCSQGHAKRHHDCDEPAALCGQLQAE